MDECDAIADGYSTRVNGSDHAAHCMCGSLRVLAQPVCRVRPAAVAVGRAERCETTAHVAATTLAVVEREAVAMAEARGMAEADAVVSVSRRKALGVAITKHGAIVEAIGEPSPGTQSQVTPANTIQLGSWV